MAKTVHQKVEGKKEVRPMDWPSPMPFIGKDYAALALQRGRKRLRSRLPKWVARGVPMWKIARAKAYARKHVKEIEANFIPSKGYSKFDK